jgi:hypothetical protein
MNCLTRVLEPGSHPHQVGEGVRFHLLHDLPTVCLYRDFTNAQFCADLLV